MDEVKVTAVHTIIQNGGENSTGVLKKAHFVHFSVRP